MRIVLLILLLCCSPALGRAPFRATLQGVTADGCLMVGAGEGMEHGQVMVALSGIEIPPTALAPFRRYCQKVLGGRHLVVEVTETLEETPVLRSYAGRVSVVTDSGKKLSLNKQLLVDGYALADPDSELVSYEEKGRQRGYGIWSRDMGIWVTPKLPRQAPGATAQGTDRDRIIALHGMPDFTRKDNIKDTHGVIGHHLVIKDFYVRKGLVFIYRDGRLQNQQPYVER